MNILNTIILVIEIVVAFFAMMFVHELGHFIFAKRAGILVREFSIGMGPKLFSIKKGETKYSLRLLPLGAYVSMAGEDPEISDIKTGQTIGISTDSKGIVNELYLKKSKHKKIKIEEIDLEHDLFIKGYNENNELNKFAVSNDAVIHYEEKVFQIAPWDRQFRSKSILDRFSAIIAGPLFNMIFALLLFFTITFVAGVPTNQVEIGDISDGSPAEEVGLQSGDIITGIDNLVFESSEELVAKIQSSPDIEIDLIVQREGTQMIVPVIPEDADGDGIGLIGFRPIQIYSDATISQVIVNGSAEFVNWIGVIFESFEMLVSGDVSMDEISGPVGIVKVTSDAAKAGFITLMRWTAVLSLYLGIFNLLPIPALDGSRLLFILLEAIRRKPIDPQKEGMVHFIGFAFLILLMVFVTINDISNLFS